MDFAPNVVFDIHEETDDTQCDDEFINDWLRDNVEQSGVYDDESVSHVINYTENYTIKDLLHIYDYYGFSKKLKACKRTKEQLIKFLVDFETNVINTDIVCRRKTMWFYIGELKSDKFMKKYVLW